MELSLILDTLFNESRGGKIEVLGEEVKRAPFLKPPADMVLRKEDRTITLEIYPGQYPKDVQEASPAKMFQIIYFRSERELVYKISVSLWTVPEYARLITRCTEMHQESLQNRNRRAGARTVSPLNS